VDAKKQHGKAVTALVNIGSQIEELAPEMNLHWADYI
jgi:hypothetical protein